jgi:Holliday junction resolvasome RuvABC DNA-binding subunit
VPPARVTWRLSATPGLSSADAVSALLNLGFRPAEANAAVAAAEEELGAGAREARAAMTEMVVANLEAHFAGHAVPGLLG